MIQPVLAKMKSATSPDVQEESVVVLDWSPQTDGLRAHGVFLVVRANGDLEAVEDDKVRLNTRIDILPASMMPKLTT